jgi:hypothetical protein
MTKYPENIRLLESVKQRAKKTEWGYGILTADAYVKTIEDHVGPASCYRYMSKGTTSFDDLMKRASKTLVYSNPEMEIKDTKFKASNGDIGGLELPKNCLMTFRHILTSSRKDRDGDVLHSDGAKVDPKMLLLWQHVHTLPIGKALTVLKQDTDELEMVSCIVDMNDLCHDAAVMIDNGMGRFSHGFRAIRFNEIKATPEGDSGFDVKEFEIMEESLVSVPANPDAITEEILLDLVESKKLKSRILKDIGQGIRDKRKISVGGVEIKYRERNGLWQRELVCNSLDQLTAAYNARLIGDKKDENKSRDTEEDGTKQEPESTPEKTNAIPDQGGEKEIESEEVKTAIEIQPTNIVPDSLIGSWEWIQRGICGNMDAFLSQNGITINEDSWSWVIATFSNYCIACVRQRDTANTFYRINWHLSDGKIILDGEPKEVTISTTTVIVDKSLGMIPLIHNSETDTYSVDEEWEKNYKTPVVATIEEKEFSVKEATCVILTKATLEERSKLLSILKSFDEVEKQHSVAKQYQDVFYKKSK